MATSITAVFKGELKKGLTLECMSPEHSKTAKTTIIVVIPSKAKEKKIVKRPLSWRSQAFTDHLESLDRKWARRANVRSKAMAKVRHEGNFILCEPPEEIPAWMKRH